MKIIFSGIDDMFVIMQSLYNLGDQFNGNVVDTLSAALERSGVAITVTSLTDVLAFGVGATTVSNSYKKKFWCEAMHQCTTINFWELWERGVADIFCGLERPGREVCLYYVIYVSLKANKATENHSTKLRKLL